MENQAEFAFCALLSRMKYISRWGLMRSSRPENLSEHTAETAVLAHTLGLIANNIFHHADIRPETMATAALYHDASEILTGDMPTPVKYKNDRLKTAYKELEAESAQSLSQLLPPELQEAMLPLLTGTALGQEEALLLKAADRLSALVKCLEEEASGNTEFQSAKQEQLARLEEMNHPAVSYFLKNFLPCYQKDLDQLTKGI